MPNETYEFEWSTFSSPAWWIWMQKLFNLNKPFWGDNFWSLLLIPKFHTIRVCPWGEISWPSPHNCKNWLGQKFGDLSHSNRKMSKFPFSNWENGTTFFLFVGWCKVSFPSSKPPKNPHHSTCRGPAHWPFRWSLDFIRWKDDWLSRCGWITIHVFQSWRLYRLGASWRFEF